MCGGALANVKVDTSVRENVLSADDVTSVYALGVFFLFFGRPCIPVGRFLCCLGGWAARVTVLFGEERS